MTYKSRECNNIHFQESVRLLEELCRLNGVSGNEDEVRNFIYDFIKPYVDDVKIDKIGNIIAFKKSLEPQQPNKPLKVLLSAHMDEVGFIISGFTQNGWLKFKAVGGIDERILPSKKVTIGPQKINGVFASKPFHLKTKEERNRIVKVKDIYIDAGFKSIDEAQKLVCLGDYACFDSDFVFFGQSRVKARALDDRVGCVCTMQALKNRYTFDLYGCFTIQEEVGLRGSQTAAYQVAPDVALVLEGTTCSDVPGVDEADFSTIIGKGPALTIMDKTCYCDRKFTEYVYDTAIKNNIPVQYKQTATGGNDAGKIQGQKYGCRVASISVPCRYIHSPVSVMDLHDFNSYILLVEKVLERISVEKEMSFL